MKIYVASSWRNTLQEEVVIALREAGHEVYDFKNPPNGTGFDWAEVDPNWQSWTAKEFAVALSHPISERGYKSDFDGMAWADVCVLVLPCGKSAHTEAGFMAGERKPVIVLTNDNEEPELMYNLLLHTLGGITDTIGGVLSALEHPAFINYVNKELVKPEQSMTIVRIKIDGCSDYILSVEQYNEYESIDAISQELELDEGQLTHVVIDTMPVIEFNSLNCWEG